MRKKPIDVAPVRQVGIVIIMLLLVATTACHGSPEKPIRVAFNTWLGYSGFYIAESKGIFAKHGIKVEAKVVDPLDQKNAALLRGDLDAMGGTIDSAVTSAAAGVKGRIVFMFDRSNGTDGILTTSGVSSIKDLRDRTIALEEGFSGHFFLLYALDRAGMSPKDVRIVPMTTDEAGAAFAAGKVDVAVTWEPYLTTALSRRGSKVLMTSKELEPILADTLFVSDAALQARPKDIQALTDSLLEANEYWIANPDEGNKIASARWKLPLAEVQKTMSTVELYGAKQQAVQFGIDQPPALPQYIGKCADLWFATGVIKAKIAPNQLIDSQYVRNALRSK